MSRKAQPLSDADFPTAEQVVAYLRQHQEFFREHPDLLESLRLPHDCGPAVSLVERQLKLLRERNAILHSRLEEMIDTARENDLIFEKTRKLVLGILRANKLAELAKVLERNLCFELRADRCQLLLLDDASSWVAQGVSFVEREEAMTIIGSLIDSRWAVCGELSDEEKSYLFLQHASEIGSVALVPLIDEQGVTLGVLSMGSHDRQLFHSSLGTLFLDYVGEVLSLTVPRLIFHERLQLDT
ncbi:DUF484 family protein [Balneatrix alpica]|uniref:DUF484 family protein n=1 Tax=Balneatrix alpica TaxID=75684 RepID=A0ABV5ZHL6_9GAMM|nr:DUF484 family protein [Balneatrix alpica]